MADGDARLSPPVRRAARLLRHTGEGDPVANMADAARRLGINRTTLPRRPEAERFIERRAGGEPGWRIGPGLIGRAVATAVPDVSARPGWGVNARPRSLDGVA